MRMPRGVEALPPAGAIAAGVALLCASVLPAAVVEPVLVFTNLILIGSLTYLFHRTGRVPGLPRPTARFWGSMVWALGAYALGMAVDLGALLVTAVSGREVPMFGAQLVYPVAGLLILYAVFRYPTSTRSHSERLRFGLDIGIVLLGVGSFIWYFAVSDRWSPGDGLLALSGSLALPVMVLVAGFGVLRVAFVGAKLFVRETLIWYLVCIALSGVATAMPDGSGAVPLGPAVLLFLAQLASMVGALVQYRAVATSSVVSPARSRRSFSMLPYSASAAAFALLVIVVAPGLDWRQWGVLAAVGALLLLVTVRQLTALRENDRLLTENRALTEQLQHQAFHDELTGLANRAFFTRRVEEAIELYGETGADTAVLLLDLDGFKAVNDTMGHEAGDRLLVEIAGRLVREARDATVCRLGGDEFVILTAESTSDAARLADRLVQSVAVPAVIDGHPVRVGASIGITFVGDAPPSPAELLRRADAAMYAVKSAGKNSWRLSAELEIPRA